MVAAVTQSVSQVSRSGVVRVVEISLARTRRGRFQGVITVCLGRALKKTQRRGEGEGGADGVSIWFLHMTASRGRRLSRHRTRRRLLLLRA